MIELLYAGLVVAGVVWYFLHVEKVGNGGTAPSVPILNKEGTEERRKKANEILERVKKAQAKKKQEEEDKS